MNASEHRLRQLRVPVNDHEGETIERLATESGLKVAAYLRLVGLGRTPRTEIDREQVDHLNKAMADLGRMGGLLKLWLSDDEKLAAYPAERRKQIPEVLQEIRKNQALLLEILKRLKES